MFSAPADLIAYARRRGLKAEEYNRNSLQQVRELVGQGSPVIPLLDLTPKNALDFENWHWVVVIAAEGEDEEEEVVVNNPWVRQERWAKDRLLGEWAYLKLLGLSFGYNDYFIAVGTSR